MAKRSREQWGVPPGAPPEVLDTQPFITASHDARGQYGRFNLLIVGKSGVGKSTLLNAVFGRQWAQVGVGMPVTQGLSYYHDDSLGIWDSEGFEVGSGVGPVEKIRQDLAEIRRHPRNEQVSVVWYCVAAGSGRLDTNELAVMQEISRSGLPVILVLTKTDWVRNPFTGKVEIGPAQKPFWDWLHNPVDPYGNPVFLPVTDVIATSALGNKGKGKGYGLSELVARTLLESPDDEKDAFRIAQRLNLPWKREMARSSIAMAATLAAAAAAVPVPVADAMVLAPIQLSMMGRVAAIYELEMSTMLSSGALAQLSAQFAGRALARSLIKLIPGVGSVINASVASAITAATGEGWMRLCERVYQGEIKATELDAMMKKFTPSAREVLQQLFKEKLTGRV